MEDIPQARGYDSSPVIVPQCMPSVNEETADLLGTSVMDLFFTARSLVKHLNFFGPSRVDITSAAEY